MRTSLIRRARHWIVNRGWRGFAAEVVRRARLILTGKQPLRARPATVPVTHPFDAQHGVDTGGLIFGEQLDVSQKNSQTDTRANPQTGLKRAPTPEAYWATAYYGIAPSVFTAALERLDLPWSRYTFLDVGCGKGRALMLAARFPFHAVLGVELSPELARIAAQNLQHFQAAQLQSAPATVLYGDATTMRFPDGPLVISLYHPFAAPVMRRFLARLQASLAESPREAWILYTNPELHPLLNAQPWLRTAWTGIFTLSSEDREADRFGSEWEKVIAYRAV